MLLVLVTAGCSAIAGPAPPTETFGPVVSIEPGGAGPDEPIQLGFSPGAGLRDQDDDALARDLDAMAEVGAGWIRIDLDWSQIETAPGTFDWDSTDRLVAAAQARGLEVLGLLAYSPGWARPDGTSDKAPPIDDAAFGQFVVEVVTRYQPMGIVTWEIWNEPNSHLFWDPEPDPVRYGQLLTAATAAIRTVDEDAVVVSGGLAPGRDESDGSAYAPITFLEELIATGALADVDAVGIHPYSFPARPLDPGSARWNTFLRLPDLHQLLVDTGAGPTDVWITEYGAPTGSNERSLSEQDQSTLILDALGVGIDRPWLGPIFLYAIRDYRHDPDDLEWNFGVLNHDGSPKRAWLDLRALELAG